MIYFVYVIFSSQAFTQMNPKLSPLKDGCRENKRQWQKLADAHKAEVFFRGYNSLGIVSIVELLFTVQMNS